MHKLLGCWRYAVLCLLECLLVLALLLVVALCVLFEFCPAAVPARLNAVLDPALDGLEQSMPAVKAARALGMHWLVLALGAIVPVWPYLRWLDRACRRAARAVQPARQSVAEPRGERKAGRPRLLKELLSGD